MEPERIAERPVEPEAQAPPEGGAETPAVALVESDLLIEDVSIDGMCGVY
jgi:mycofactocin precursor